MEVFMHKDRNGPGERFSTYLVVAVVVERFSVVYCGGLRRGFGAVACLHRPHIAIAECRWRWCQNLVGVPGDVVATCC